MHELAHCKQMNHSKAFWKVRNEYAESLKELWSRDYYGEGMWGKGRSLLSGRYAGNANPDAGAGVRSVCGGTYRGRAGRKRKRAAEKPKLTYAERQQRHVKRKFGKHGDGAALGENELVRGYLETGRSSGAKPKVAGSKRGRELRAAAALNRFENAKPSPDQEPDLDADGSETDSDVAEPSDMDGSERLTNAKGERVKDAAGHDLCRVCEEEDPDDGDARREMDELRTLDSWVKKEPHSAYDDFDLEPTRSSTKHEVKKESHSSLDDTALGVTAITTKLKEPSLPAHVTCAICSLEHESGTARCLACAHVLDKRKLPGAWLCQSANCKILGYLNAADCGVCGLCGTTK